MLKQRAAETDGIAIAIAAAKRADPRHLHTLAAPSFSLTTASDQRTEARGENRLFK